MYRTYYAGKLHARQLIPVTVDESPREEEGSEDENEEKEDEK